MVINEEQVTLLMHNLRLKHTHLELAQPVSKLKEAHIKRPRAKPIVLTIGTTATLPETEQNQTKIKIS